MSGPVDRTLGKEDEQRQHLKTSANSLKENNFESSGVVSIVAPCFNVERYANTVK